MAKLWHIMDYDERVGALQATPKRKHPARV
jgi:hypothetical protein